LHVLTRILQNSATFDDAIEAMPEAMDLEPRDRGFLMALVLTTLRRKGEADAVVDVFLSRSLPRKAGIARLILTLGAVQLLFLEQPPHAVIDLSVRLAKRDSSALHFAGLINAVLRKVAEKGMAILDGLDGPRLNTPDWLWSRWSKAHGPETAIEIATAHMVEPALDFTVPKDGAAWAVRLGGDVLPTGSVRLGKPHGPVENLPGYGEGAWWVQDAASAIPARLLGPLAGKSVLDLCAAPGGKTLQLCAAGAQVTAVDNSAKRLERLRANLDRMRFQAEEIVVDALTFDPARKFDAVLLDAPCSATGTIRRHPELPHIKTAGEVGALVPFQRRMLAQAAKLVKPGGILIYCVCSLEAAEGERQIVSFLAGHPQFSVVPISARECGIEPHMLTEHGFFRTFPHMAIGNFFGIDGFFAARLRRSF
jgi:16S rRNA (cytosine967-C5)-methyltransferase